MVKPPKNPDAAEVDPRGGDAILKRMLQAKPKTHDDMVKERHKPQAVSSSGTKSKGAK